MKMKFFLKRAFEEDSREETIDNVVNVIAEDRPRKDDYHDLKLIRENGEDKRLTQSKVIDVQSDMISVNIVERKSDNNKRIRERNNVIGVWEHIEQVKDNFGSHTNLAYQLLYFDEGNQMSVRRFSLGEGDVIEIDHPDLGHIEKSAKDIQTDNSLF